jgi:hypothetical protein
MSMMCLLKVLGAARPNLCPIVELFVRFYRKRPADGSGWFGWRSSSCPDEREQ